MTDYSKMSDFEINSAVSMAMLTESKNPSSKYVVVNDYCNNPADAWPIILENRISIMQEIKCDCAAFGGFSMHHSGQADWDVCACDKNPLRAAMIVFLMMREDKK